MLVAQLDFTNKALEIQIAQLLEKHQQLTTESEHMRTTYVELKTSEESLCTKLKYVTFPNVY